MLMTSTFLCRGIGIFFMEEIMLFSIALIFLGGLVLSYFCEKIKLPQLIGMLFLGIMIGPSVFNLLDDKILGISSELRRIALIIILTRAGLGLKFSDVKRAGLPVLLLSFLPATFEIIGITIFAPMFLGLTHGEAFILGSVLAAVSPAVVVPKMLELMDKKYGTAKSIPQMIVAASSMDDIFAIVIFFLAIGIEMGDGFNLYSLIEIPIKIVLGIFGGVGVGFIITKFFSKLKVNSVIKSIVLLSISFLLATFEDLNFVPFSGYIAIMSMGMMISNFSINESERLSKVYSEMWIVAQILLFVLVGSIVDINYAKDAGFFAIVLIFVGLLFRAVGSYISVSTGNLNAREKLFSVFSYMPKATVQAAIGGVPLSLGLSCGNIILTVSVVAILITAPIGAILIDKTHKKLLEKN